MEVWVSHYELKELLGAQEAKLLCTHFGGLRQWMPRKAEARHPFAAIISMQSLRALCAAYGGGRIVLPNGRRAEPRRDEIIAALEQGTPVRRIALDLGVTERWVHALAGLHKISTRQLLLPLG